MDNQQLDFLDILNIMSFIIGVMNLNENMTQRDKQDLMKTLDEQTNVLLGGIHAHLKEQDVKIDRIIERLEAMGIDD